MERQLLHPFRSIDVDWYRSADSFWFRIQNRSGRTTGRQAEVTVDSRDPLPTLRELGGGSDYVALLGIPDDIPEEAIRLGSSGAALRISDDVGGIKTLAEILF